jgi:hypothetical protein
MGQDDYELQNENVELTMAYFVILFKHLPVMMICLQATKCTPGALNHYNAIFSLNIKNTDSKK